MLTTPVAEKSRKSGRVKSTFGMSTAPSTTANSGPFPRNSYFSSAYPQATATSVPTPAPTVEYRAELASQRPKMPSL